MQKDQMIDTINGYGQTMQKDQIIDTINGYGSSGNIKVMQKEVRESVRGMDSLILRIMLESERSSIEHLEKMRQFFQDQTEEEGRQSFREELLKYIQSEYRLQEMGILDQERRDFVESIRICYRNMQEIIKKGLKTTQQEVDYLNLFSKLLQIKEQLIKIYQDLANYHYPVLYSDILRSLTKFLKFLQEEKAAYMQEQLRGLSMYYRFLMFELKALLQLAYTLQEQENITALYYHERMLFQLLKLKQAIVEWLQIFADEPECDPHKFKQLLFFQNEHFLLKSKLDFYTYCTAPHKFSFPQRSQQNHNATHTNSSIQSNPYNQMSGLSFYRNNLKRISKVDVQLENQLGDNNIMWKLFRKLQELFPKTVVLMLESVKSEKYMQKRESIRQEEIQMQRESNTPEIIDGEYQIVFKQCQLSEQQFQEHVKQVMEYFKIQIGLVDNYIECSKYLMSSLQQFLFYKLDEQYYLLFEIYETTDKKQSNSAIDYISQLCEFLRNKNALFLSKDSFKPLKTFSEFVKEKLDTPVSNLNIPRTK